MTAEELSVEVVFASTAIQVLFELQLSAGASVADAIAAAGIDERFPDENIASLDVGIWGRIVSRDCPLTDGDRVELYRPLLREPREARRLLAASGKTMRGAAEQ